MAGPMKHGIEWEEEGQEIEVGEERDHKEEERGCQKKVERTVGGMERRAVHWLTFRGQMNWAEPVSGS